MMMSQKGSTWSPLTPPRPVSVLNYWHYRYWATMNYPDAPSCAAGWLRNWRGLYSAHL